MKSEIQKLNYPFLTINQVHFHRNKHENGFWIIVLEETRNPVLKIKLIVTFSINYDKNGDFINIDQKNCRVITPDDIFHTFNGSWYADKLNQMILEKTLLLEEDSF